MSSARKEAAWRTDGRKQEDSSYNALERIRDFLPALVDRHELVDTIVRLEASQVHDDGTGMASRIKTRALYQPFCWRTNMAAQDTTIKRQDPKPAKMPTVRAWRRRYQSVNFAFVFTETIESVLPAKLPILSLCLTLLLQMAWTVRDARRKRLGREHVAAA